MIREITDFHDSLIRERRYALLQAAATILDFSDGINIVAAVDYAEALLADIEKREKKS